MLRHVLAMTLAATLAGCGDISSSGGDDSPGIVGTGSGDTRSYAADGFTGIVAAGPDLIDVRVGPAFSVRAQGSEQALGALRIRRQGGNLQVDRRSGVTVSGEPAHVSVTLPCLVEVSLAGSGDMMVDRIAGERFDANAAGSGSLRIATLATQRTDFNLAGSSSVAAAGSGGELHVAIAGSGTLAAPRLVASRATISIAGSGSVVAAVSGDADVQIMGSGDVNLGAGARCTVTRMGSGHVTCGSGAAGTANGTSGND